MPKSVPLVLAILLLLTLSSLSVSAMVQPAVAPSHASHRSGELSSPVIVRSEVARPNDLGSYTVNFTETGMPPGTSWGITVYENGSDFNAQFDAYYGVASISLSDGAYVYEMDVYSSGNFSGSDMFGYFTINGGDLAIRISVEYLLPVHFVESGEVDGLVWTAEVGSNSYSTNASSLWANIVNATSTPYSINPPPGYNSTPLTGSIEVNGTPGAVSLAFSWNTTGPRHNLWFNETGLPLGAEWGITLEAMKMSTMTDSIDFLLPDGVDYPYAVTTPTAFATDYPSGSATVSGSNYALSVDFFYEVGCYTLPIWFNETGLPSATNWSVDLEPGSGGSNTTLYSHGTSSIRVSLPSGSQGNFSIQVGPKYIANPPNGAYTVPEFVPNYSIAVGFSVRPGVAIHIVRLSASPNSIQTGQNLTISAVATGGYGGLSYSYTGLPSPCTDENVSQVGCRPDASGSFLITLTVVDAIGDRAQANLTLVVSAPASSETAPSVGGVSLIYLGIGLAVVVAVVVALLFVLRRRPPR